jgi:DNA-nicking Smr family endonuclease
MVDKEDELFEAWLKQPAEPDEAVDELFLAAVEQLGPASTRPVSPTTEAAAARSKRGLRRRAAAGKIRPERDLDLHGMTRETARHATALFLERARRDGLAVVRIVCGVGIHSVEEPVLRSALEEWLRCDFRSVLWEAVQTPPSQGGRGAYLVFLRAR